MQPLHTLKAHSKEIDDLDFSRYENYLVSIAKDGIAVIWDYVKGKEVHRLTWKQPEGSKYLYKRCRYITFFLTPKNHTTAYFILVLVLSREKKIRAPSIC